MLDTPNAEARRVAVIIPTLNAGELAPRMTAALATQGIDPASCLVIDSGSRDDTVATFRAFGAEVVGLNGRPHIAR